MKRWLIGSLLLLPVLAAIAEDPERSERHRRAVREIERLGGRVEPKVRLADDHHYLMMVTAADWTGGDDGLALLKDLEGLEKLRLGGEITDAGLAHLADLHELRAVDLHLLTITDKGLAHLKGLPKLERLNLTYAPITDASLSEIAELRSLKWLGLVYTRVTAEGVAQLQRKMPDVIIQGSY